MSLPPAQAPTRATGCGSARTSRSTSAAPSSQSRGRRIIRNGASDGMSPSLPYPARGVRAAQAAVTRTACHQAKTMVWLPLRITRSSLCHCTARDSTVRSTSAPRRWRSATVSAWVTRTTSCSMIGPSSRSSVT